MEAGQPDTTRINKIQAKQLKRKMRRINNGADLSLKDGIDEADDDSEYEFYVKENEELNHQYEKQIYNDDSNSDEDESDSGSFHTAEKESGSESYYSESEDDEEASDCEQFEVWSRSVLVFELLEVAIRNVDCRI